MALEIIAKPFKAIGNCAVKAKDTTKDAAVYAAGKVKDLANGIFSGIKKVYNQIENLVKVCWDWKVEIIFAYLFVTTFPLIAVVKTSLIVMGYIAAKILQYIVNPQPNSIISRGWDHMSSLIDKGADIFRNDLYSLRRGV